MAGTLGEELNQSVHKFLLLFMNFKHTMQDNFKIKFPPTICNAEAASNFSGFAQKISPGSLVTGNSSPWTRPRTTLEKVAKFQVKAWHGSQPNYLNRTFNKRLVQCHNTYLTELELFFSKSFCLQTSIVSSFIKQV